MQDPLHVAIIMDGNGRWAQARGRPREWGHRVGARTVRGLVEAAPERGIGTLTLYAFSSDNWRRPEREVAGIMALFRRYLRSEIPALVEEGVRLRMVGRRDRLPDDVVAAMNEAETATAHSERMTLRLAVDYSSRSLLASAAARLAADVAHQAHGGGSTAEGADEAGGDGFGADVTHEIDRAAFATALGEVMHAGGPAPDVDLLIRTGGERRLSDFLLWECAYAELVFTDCMWPEFGKEDLDAALREYGQRDRRFGRVVAAS